MHYRFFHMCEKYLKIMFPYLKSQTLTKCVPCALAKVRRAIIKKRVDPETQPNKAGEKVASDLKVMPGVGAGGKRYVGSIIDVKSRFTFLTFLNLKSDFGPLYKKVMETLRHNFGEYTQQWKTDGGGEFVNRDLDAFNEEHDIHHETTPAYTSVKNGIAESFNRTLIEAVASMLIMACMPIRFWVYEAQYFVYLKNRTPHRHLDFKTPFEVFFQRKPHILGTRVFGCLAIVKDKKAPKSELERGTSCVFLGVDAAKGSYRFMDLQTRQLLTSDSCMFFEKCFPFKHSTNPMAVQIVKTQENPTNDQEDQQVLEESKTSTENGLNRTELSPNLGHFPPCTNLPNVALPGDVRDGHVSSFPSVQQDSQMPPLERVVPDLTVQSPLSQEQETLESKHASPPPPRRSGRLRNMSLDGLIPAANTPPRRQEQHRDIKEVALSPVLESVPSPSRTSLTDEPTAVSTLELLTGRNSATSSTTEAVTAPNSITEARLSPEWPRWKKAILAELKAIIQNQTWKSVRSCPVGHRPLTSRWVFKVKPATAHEPERYKARLVAHGFRQVKGVNFDETFAAVARMESLRTIVSISANRNLRMTKLDVDNAFLQGKIDKKVYMNPPPGFPEIGIVELQKALYGLKQAPRLWYQTLVGALRELDFEPILTDECVLKHKTSEFWVLVYVDDVILSTADEGLRSKVVSLLERRFSLKDFGDLKSFIALELEYNDKFIKLHQKTYIEALLIKYGLAEAKSVSTPMVPQGQHYQDTSPCRDKPYRELVGSLLYLFATRPDICTAVIELTRHVQSPRACDWQAARHLLRYLKGSADKGVCYPRGGCDSTFKIVAYSDSDWAGCKLTRKSITGYIIYLNGGPIAWKSRMQSVIALSSCEAEYLALTETVKEVMWQQQNLRELGIHIETPVTIHADNKAALALAKNPINHQRTKHIDIRHHFLRGIINEKKIGLAYIPSKANAADILTKAATVDTFRRLAPH